MKSLRDSAQRGGIIDPQPSVRDLGRRAGMTPPFSMADLMKRLENPPLEEVKFRQNVVTGGLAALGGYVELTLRNDGTYNAHFHMFDSGAVDYNFQVRALFVTSQGMAFALQQSGKVEGTESALKLRRIKNKFDNDQKGSHPLIKEHWPAVKAGKLTVTKEYSAGGIAGFVEDVVKTVAGLAADATHTVGGVVIGLGDEMVNAINSVNVNIDLGIVAGAVVFAAGGGLVLATVTGVQFGAVTATLIHPKPVEKADYDWAAKVFGGSLPPRENLVLTNLESFGGRAITLPGPHGKIYLNVGAYCQEHPTTHIQPSYPRPGQLFIHELTHAWQIHYRSFVPGWLCEGAVLQTRKFFGARVYRYGPAGQPWSEYNLEKQASIVDDWFAGTRNGLDPVTKMPLLTPMDPADDYYRYIRDNILQGRT